MPVTQNISDYERYEKSGRFGTLCRVREDGSRMWLALSEVTMRAGLRRWSFRSDIAAVISELEADRIISTHDGHLEFIPHSQF